MDATERLRRAAQNEATCIELNRMLRERDADLARLTAELDNAKIAIDGLQNTLRKEREQHHKAQDELEKENAQSRHLAEAMSRKIEELIAAENQCSYYKAQYTRAEQTRKEACDANVKAQADMLWAKAELERKQRECEGLRKAFRRISAGLRTAGASLPAPENKGTIESAMQTGLSIALLLVEEELADLSAGEKE